MKINQIFAAENFSAPAKREWVRQETEYLLKVMEADPNFALAERFGPELSPASLVRFFRHRERTEASRRTIQYLLSFLAHIPRPMEIAEEPVNPAEQFRDFIRYQTDLLLEEDVKSAVFDEANSGNARAGEHVWDFQERIIVMNRKLRNMLAKEEGNLALSISNQCRALEQLTLFWFDVRRHDLRRTRRSDIFMYLLAQMVRQRCWEVATP
ncbi:MAG: hypothetical protein MUF02_06055 [Acidobacteria bacterium]|jgi:hypothetical protein|nr:hypothetical protein [Acidobacteriota bacterium]